MAEYKLTNKAVVVNEKLSDYKKRKEALVKELDNNESKISKLQQELDMLNQQMEFINSLSGKRTGSSSPMASLLSGMMLGKMQADMRDSEEGESADISEFLEDEDIPSEIRNFISGLMDDEDAEVSVHVIKISDKEK